MHGYHFSGYEPGALKRLMGWHATRADEIDRLLRGRVLVDLHIVLKRAVRASVETYSLKALEAFHGFERKIPLEQASHAMRRLQHALELGKAGEIDHTVRDMARLNGMIVHPLWLCAAGSNGRARPQGFVAACSPDAAAESRNVNGARPISSTTAEQPGCDFVPASIDIAANRRRIGERSSSRELSEDLLHERSGLTAADFCNGWGGTEIPATAA
jgi:hypothetical protein